MMRTFSAMAIAGLVLVAVAGISQAAPIAPLPTGVMADHSNVMQVRWHRPLLARSLGPLALPEGVVVGIFLLRCTERSHHQNAERKFIQSEAISFQQIENCRLPPLIP